MCIVCLFSAPSVTDAIPPTTVPPTTVINTVTTAPATTTVTTVAPITTIATVTTTTPSAVSTVTFTTARSGLFTSSTTWVGGIVPTGSCSITISANFVIIFTGATLDIDLQTLIIEGTFIIQSTGGVGFTFTSAVNIIIRDGATLTDQSDNNQIYCLAGSMFTFSAGASFTGNNTKVSVYKSIPAPGSLGAYFTLGSNVSGPFTLGILLDGSIETFTRVTFIARQNGSFTFSSTWLGGVVPTAAACASDGCGLLIAPGVSLSTESLNGELNINFSVVTVRAGATFRLGAVGLTTGFRFRFRVLFVCYGILQDATESAGGIFLTSGSNFNLFGGGSFSSSVSTFLFIYNVETGVTIGTGLTLSASLTGPYFVSVSVTGETSVSTSSKESFSS
jgi:hypothetical protein